MEPTVIEVSGERPYPVLVGRDLLGDLPPLLGSAAQAAVVFAGPVREHAARVVEALRGAGVAPLPLECSTRISRVQPSRASSVPPARCASPTIRSIRR